MSPLVLYVHGFQSSPQSAKAQQCKKYLQRSSPELEFLAPQIPSYPLQAIRLLKAIIERNAGRRVVLLGSSLGGYYALHLAQHFGLRAALINPSIYPFKTIAQYLGPQINPYTNEQFTLQERHISELQNMQVRLQADEYQNFLLLLQTGDETLDFTEASAYLCGARAIIEYGGNHSFVGFNRWLPEIMAFLDA
ncbi:MAG: YqiA/YcfP family alpha/beta fold hydrolase [Pseudomonadales bacterium]